MPELADQLQLEMQTDLISQYEVQLRQDYPVAIDGATGYLIRRLADGSFILLHPPGTLSNLVVQTIELEPHDGSRMMEGMIRVFDTGCQVAGSKT